MVTNGYYMGLQVNAIQHVMFYFPRVLYECYDYQAYIYIVSVKATYLTYICKQ